MRLGKSPPYHSQFADRKIAVPLHLSAVCLSEPQPLLAFSVSTWDGYQSSCFFLLGVPYFADIISAACLSSCQWRCEVFQKIDLFRMLPSLSHIYYCPILSHIYPQKHPLTELLLYHLMVTTLLHRNQGSPNPQRYHKMVLSCHQSHRQHHMTLHPSWKCFGKLT